MNNKIKKWIQENSMIVMLLVLFFAAPYALRSVDPTAASFDAGILHTIVVVCFAFSVFQACTWSVVKTIWPDIGHYFRTGFFKDDFKRLSPEKKVPISLAVYFIIFISFVILTCAVL